MIDSSTPQDAPKDTPVTELLDRLLGAVWFLSEGRAKDFDDAVRVGQEALATREAIDEALAALSLENQRLREGNDRLRHRLDEWSEAEASVCPEDVGFVEYIHSLEKRLAKLTSPEIQDKLNDLLFAWLYAHQDATAGRAPPESVTAPYQAIVSYIEKRTLTRADALFLYGIPTHPGCDPAVEIERDRIIEKFLPLFSTEEGV